MIGRLTQLEARILSRADTLVSLAQQRLELSVQKLSMSVSQHTNHSRDRLRRLERKLVPPSEYIGLKRYDVGHLQKRLWRAIDQGIKQTSLVLGHLTAKLDSLSPLATLGRGYGILLKGDTDGHRSIGSVDDVERAITS